jgi:transcription-repair coupling factor (superfamily II helicase)
MSASIPESYILDIDQRLTSYRRLAKMTELNEIADFKVELMDRFGALPVETANLLLKIMLKVLAIKAGVKRLDLAGQRLTLCFSEAHQKNPSGIMEMVLSEGKRFEFAPDNIIIAKLLKGKTTDLLGQTKNILKDIAQRVSD